MLSLLKDVSLTHLLSIISEELLANKNFISQAVYTNCQILEHADDSIRKDADFLFSLHPKNYIDIVRFAHPDLKKDPNFIYESIKNYFNYKEDILNLADPELKGNKELIVKLIDLSLMRQWMYPLAWSLEELRNDRQFLLEIAGRTWGAALEYVTDPAIHTDKAFILEMFDRAGLNGEGLMQHISLELKNDNKFLLELLQKGVRIFQSCYWRDNEKRLLELLQDTEFMQAARIIDPDIDRYNEYFSLQRFHYLRAKAAIQTDPQNFLTLDDGIKQRESVWLCAIKEEPSLFLNPWFDGVRRNKETLEKAIEANENVLAFIDLETRKTYNLGNTSQVKGSNSRI